METIAFSEDLSHDALTIYYAPKQIEARRNLDPTLTVGRAGFVKLPAVVLSCLTTEDDTTTKARNRALADAMPRLPQRRQPS